MPESMAVGRKENSQKVDEYGQSLAGLTPGRVKEEPTLLLNVLMRRDGVAALTARGDCSPEDAVRLMTFDEALRVSATELSEALPSGTLDAWRSCLCPSAAADAWWWRLDQVPIERAQKRSPWWPVTTGLLLAISASVTADIARRFLSNGPDFYGALSTISQGAVTIIAGSSLTETGRNWLNKWLRSFGVHPERSPRVYAMLAAGVLAFVGALYLSLPQIALGYYDARGRRLFREGNAHSAIEHFRRAVSLAPSEYLPHYDLADALEESFDVDKAIGEYQATIQLKPDFYQAYNNLARIYLVKKKDHEGALRALRTGINYLQKAVEESPQVKCPSPDALCDGLYALHKNFAWVNVERQWYRLARISASAALKAHPDRAGIYCLLAQIETAEGNSAAADKNWHTCLVRAPQLHASGSSRHEDVEETWIAMARELEAKR